jgi:beta-galactosidase
VYITTPKVSESAATINVQTTLIHDQQNTQPLRIRTSILDAKDKVVAFVEIPITFSKSPNLTIGQSIQLSYPYLWSPSSPYLYPQ